MKINFALIIVLAGITTALTMVVRIPIPATEGYLNLGDMAVVFCGLLIGSRWGLLAGAIGSATADLIGGFFIFIPITFFAKGLEAYIAGTLGKKNPYWLGLAGIAMVCVYFIAELFLPNMGFAAAVTELPFNVVQAFIGAIGGWAVYKGVIIAFPKPPSNKV